MAFLRESDELWTEFAGIIRDEGLELYDLEQVARGSLRVTIEKNSSNEASTRGRAEKASCEPDSDVDAEFSVSEVVVDPESEGLMQAERVTSGDCSRVCRRLMVFCLAEGQRLGVGSEPEIDVSSPGLDRTLRLPRHFETAVGEIVSCIPAHDKPWAEIEGKSLRGVLRGRLESVNESGIVVSEERTRAEISIPFGMLKRSNVEFVREETKVPGKKGKGRHAA